VALATSTERGIVTNYSPARTALEKILGRPFTDYQWALLVSQGYEKAILSQARTAEEVAHELQDLVTVLGGGSAGKGGAAAGAGAGAPAHRTRVPDPKTWEEMEKVVLAKSLARGGHGGAGGADGATANRVRHDNSPKPSHRRWWISATLTVLGVVLVVVLLLVFVKPAGTSSSSNTTATLAVLTTTTIALPTTTTNSTTSTTTTSSTTTTLAPTTTTTEDPTPTFTARLSGQNVVPPVVTDATGTFSITIAEDGASAAFTLTVEGMADLTIVRMRTAAAGATGDEIFTVYPGPLMMGPFDGPAVEGTLTPAQFVGPLAGKTMADFVALVRSGAVYINVGSSRNTTGEIRGQLE
jgi:hypothetical protein